MRLIPALDGSKLYKPYVKNNEGKIGIYKVPENIIFS